jgi:hypothetical protein
MFANCTWYTVASDPRPTAPGSGSELIPLNPHPLSAKAAQAPTATSLRRLLPAVTGFLR